ncbi:MAG: malate:quinone oxidoreductase [Pseudomonadota bacterium]|jgi:malate dehydrogenase (quinone)
MNYDVAIVGGGISGCALAFILARYTDIEKIVVIEKYEKVASLSSSGGNNSQTNHRGEIETNYTLDKARAVKAKADMVTRYCLDRNLQDSAIFKMQKMAIGVGDEQVAFIRKRTEEFKSLYPELEVFEKEELKEIEPAIIYMDGKNGSEVRPDNIIGSGIRDAWCAINYEEMTKQLIQDAKDEGKVELKLNSQVTKITKDNGGYKLETVSGEINAKFVLVDAGAHSLYLANKMGFGKQYSVLPVAGSFYFSTVENILNGKVYTVQHPKLPFAAIHGDPDIVEKNKTRFGPTALVMPKLERFKPGTYCDFFQSLNLNMGVLSVYKDLFLDRDIGSYVLENIAFELPLNIGRDLYSKEIQKIVPSTQKTELKYADGFGGVRPQMIDSQQKKLILGEVAIKTGEGITFNMTPSPGATSCLGNAIEDSKEIVAYLGKTLNLAKLQEELGYE